MTNTHISPRLTAAPPGTGQSPTPIPTIRASGLVKTWPGGVEAVKGIDFEVASGEVFGLLGANGAGKSTTIGMLTTAVAPTAGDARICGFDVYTEPVAARAVSAVVFQDATIDKGLSGHHNLRIHAALWGVRRDVAERRIAGVAADFGLGELLDRPVGTYSGGQRRRLEIARALLSEPRVLFLDEPTVGLDPRIRFELLDVIAGLRARSGMTVLLTTHYLDEAERLCDRIAVMSLGTIVALDTPGNLIAALGGEVVELRVATDPARALQRLRSEGLADDDAFAVGSTLILPVRARAAGDVAAAIGRSDLVTTALSTRQPTLDDVYLRLTGDRVAA